MQKEVLKWLAIIAQKVGGLKDRRTEGGPQALKKSHP